MERIIKFRAKMTDSMAESVNCDGDRWVQGFYFKKLIGGKLVSIITDGAHEFEVDESTLGQFTGLKDKNGTEIYENDWLTTNKKDMIVEVWYSEDEACWIGEIIHPFGAMVDLFSNFNLDDLTIIGNKYDSMELLEKL